MIFNGLDLRSIELISVAHNKYEFQGLSVDRPLLDDPIVVGSIGSGSSFLEIDTSTAYLFNKPTSAWYAL